MAMKKETQASPGFIAGVLKAAARAEAQGIMTPEADAALSEYLRGQEAARPILENDDDRIVKQRLAQRESDEPVVGDYVVFGNRPRMERISHDWGDAVQTSVDGSWYLGDGGYVSFSGGLNPPIPKAELADTGETEPGSFWIFHHDEWRANNAHQFKAPCRIWRLVSC